MGNTPSIKKVGFEDIQYIQKNNNCGILINTLGSNDQKCVITGTISPNNEEKVIKETPKVEETKPEPPKNTYVSSWGSPGGNRTKKH